MEKLIVKNFLSLQDIELSISKINIFIGPQAQGKSILAKLVYFCKSFFLLYCHTMGFKGLKKLEFDKVVISTFKTIFPEYVWKKQEFEILYEFNTYYLSLSNKPKSNSKQHKLSLEYSEYLVKIRRNIIAEYKPKILGQIPSSKSTLELVKEYYEEIFPRYFFQDKMENELDYLVFIPAGRSFFADVQKNVFSFLSGQITIDYFLKEFGSIYEMIKNTYPDRQIFNKEHPDIMDKLVTSIISGDYINEKGQDWICTNDNRKINLSNCSSGQQEALPIVIILAVLPFFSPSYLTTSNFSVSPSYLFNRMFIIEEPEAHLFPTSQKDIINLMSLVFNLTEKKHKFFITTHSPYILTAFNNLIQAGNTLKVLKEKPNSEELIKKLTSIIPENQMLDINDIGAYTLKDGMLESIINKENKLIDTNIIDEVSNEFSRIFEQLLDLELGE